MPVDKRLYMTFPNDFWLHPKIAPLSVSAKWAFVEMNGYSRMHDLDGRIPVKLARHQWKPKVLAELVDSHPSRPLVILDGDEYVIRDYAEHQETRESIAKRTETNRANGAKGGRPKNPKKTDSVTGSVRNGNPDITQPKAESESESDIETDVTYLPESSHLGDGSETDSDPVSVWKFQARSVGIMDLPAARDMLAATVREPVSMRGALELCKAILSKSARAVRDADAYVATTCRKSAAEVERAYFDLDIAAYEGVAS